MTLARDLLNARTSLNSVRANVILAQARLLTAMGALDFTDLLPDAGQYDATTHFDRVDGHADVPLLTPLVRAIDSLFSGPKLARPVRDPAADLGIGEAVPMQP
jgi:outer membrane protein